MEHITDDVVGKEVVDSDGATVGKITAVEDDKAILKGETGASVEMEASVSREEDDRIALDADQIASVKDEQVRLSSDAAGD